jgi:hypothetical protein
MGLVRYKSFEPGLYVDDACDLGWINPSVIIRARTTVVDTPSAYPFFSETPPVRTQTAAPSLRERTTPACAPKRRRQPQQRCTARVVDSQRRRDLPRPSSSRGRRSPKSSSSRHLPLHIYLNPLLWIHSNPNAYAAR